MHVFLPDLRINATLHGTEGAPALVLSHALGTDQTIFADLIRLLPGLRILSYDHRGHGASDVPAGPYAMGAMIRDAERLMDHFALKDAVFLGVSLGGLVAQGLAIKRLDLVRGLVLSNTAARIGAPSMWHTRVAEVQSQGLAAYAPGALQRQLGPKWRDHPARARLETLLTATDPQGWCASAHAIAGADFTLTTPTLRLPTLVIAGPNDGTTPPDLVRETAEMIPGARFHLMRGTGHLPMVEQPAAYADTLLQFLTEIGHR